MRRSCWIRYSRPEPTAVERLTRGPDLLRGLQNAPRTLLSPDAWFRAYINPYELLAVDRRATFDEIDPARVQRLRKALLAEIQLEDGRVSWLAGAVVDRSHAIAVCDELNDDRKRKAHWIVFQHLPLLRFLTHGEHALFTVEESSPLGLIENAPADFGKWLSRPFARQYGAVLARAIEHRQIAVIEYMLQGRKWVQPEDEDACFEPARRAIEVSVLQPLRAMAQSAEQVKPGGEAVMRLVADGSLQHTFRLLPMHFRDLQHEAIEKLHAIGVAAANRFNDVELARDVLQIAMNLDPRSPQWRARIHEAIRQLDHVRRRRRQPGVEVSMGSTMWRFGEEGLTQGASFMSIQSIAAVRWGMHLLPDLAHQFTFRFTDDGGRNLVFAWRAAAASFDREKARFETLHAAAVSYVVPAAIERLEAQLQAGSVLQIGPCRLDEQVRNSRHGAGSGRGFAGLHGEISRSALSTGLSSWPTPTRSAIACSWIPLQSITRHSSNSWCNAGRGEPSMSYPQHPIGYPPVSEVPAYLMSLLRNLYEIERKLALHGDPGNAGRNVQRMRELFEEHELFYEDPLGQPFDETRTDLQATISGPVVEGLVVVEVIRPIIRHGTRACSRVVQKGVVVVRAPVQERPP